MKLYSTFLVLCCVLGITCSDTSQRSSKINGISLVSTRHQLTNENLSAVNRTHANWIALVPYGFSRQGEPKVYYNSRVQWAGERPEGLKQAAQTAKKQGFKIMLKPQLWIGGQAWSGEFNLATEEQWIRWEKSYSAFIVQMAKLAEDQNIDLLCIGTELKTTVKSRPEFWRKLISRLRSIYHGKLTYAANWDNYQNIPFWDALDYIGVDAYFPLSSQATPKVEVLKMAWQKPEDRLKKFQERLKKQVLFTEYGYRNIDKSAGQQWQLPPSRHYSGKLNPVAQANAYRAFYAVFWSKNWVAGGFIWKWYPNDSRLVHQKNSGYTPQHKPVEHIIAETYGH